MATKRKDSALTHFRLRSERYNRSANWVADAKLLGRMSALADAHAGETVLDLCTGTGFVGKQFKGKVREVVGVDISAEMTAQAAGSVDRVVIAPLEKLPFEDASADLCVCRQGLQFTDLPKALAEIRRVLKPGGRTVLCHLCAYGPEDFEEAFKIQALRNPARVNFFLPGDLEKALEKAGLRVTKVERYLSRESVARWIDHGALTPVLKEKIMAAYRAASPSFKRIHELEEGKDDILDTMLFLIIRAEK
jgi:ubiquinone/menaquinone biosynthesis C-methylase UbiE